MDRPAEAASGDAGESAAWPWLAHAVARRPVTIRRADGDGTTFGNGAVIQLANRNARDDRMALLAHALLLRDDGLNDDVLLALRGRPVVARRYLLLETLRMADGLAMVLPRWFSDGLGPWCAIPRSADAAHSLARAEGGERVPEAPDEWGTILGRRGGPTRAATSDGSLGGKTRRRDADIDPDEETEKSRFLRFLSAPLPGNSLSTMFRNRRGVGGASRGGIGGANLADGEDVSVATTATEYVVRSAGGRPGRAAPRVVRSHVYSEWDGAGGVYRPAWCRLFEVAPKRVSEAAPIPAPSAELQHRLRRLALGPARAPGARSGDEIDFDRLVESRVQRRTGTRRPDERIYVDRVRRRPEVSVTVVLDASSSTAHQRGNRSVLDEERRLCGALLEACQMVDVRSSAFGFCSNGRESVFAVRLKGFDEPFGARARLRLAGLAPSGFTRIGTAIRHAAATVPGSAGTPRRVLLLLTDGFPYDEGYEGEYAGADTARALAEAHAAGLACACLAVGSDQQAGQLARLFDGAAAHAATATTDGALRLIVELIEHALRRPMGRPAAPSPLSWTGRN